MSRQPSPRQDRTNPHWYVLGTIRLAELLPNARARGRSAAWPDSPASDVRRAPGNHDGDWRAGPWLRRLESRSFFIAETRRDLSVLLRTCRAESSNPCGRDGLAQHPRIQQRTLTI